MAIEVETRTVVNKLKHPDGTVEEITVVERRPKKRHDSMMRHMADLAEGKRRSEELAAKAAEQTAGADVVDVVDVVGTEG